MSVTAKTESSLQAARLVVEHLLESRVCAGCQKEFGTVPEPGTSHGFCRRHFMQYHADLFDPEQIAAIPQDHFAPDMKELLDRKKTDSMGESAKPAWHSWKIDYDGKQWPLGSVEGGRLYHGSRFEMPIGTVLEGQQRRNFKESSSDFVSVTSDINRARYWAQQTTRGPVFVYEIEPLSPVVPWRVGYANYGKNISLLEGRTKQARIVGLF